MQLTSTTEEETGSHPIQAEKQVEMQPEKQPTEKQLKKQPKKQTEQQVKEEKEVAPSSPQTPQTTQKKGAKSRAGWLAIVIPVGTAICFGGADWFVRNLWIITNNLNQPYALLAGPALIASLIAGWIIFGMIRNLQKVIAWLKAKKDNKILFYYTVLVVFMVVSVTESGQYFNTVDHNALGGVMGYSVAMVVDLIAAISMQARLEATRVSDEAGARLFLICVMICAAFSAYANVNVSIHNYNSADLTGIPDWMDFLNHWVGLVFPMMITMITVAADYIVDREGGKMDATKFKKQQEDRFELLKAKREMLEKTREEERKIENLMKDRLAARPSLWTGIIQFFHPTINMKKAVAQVLEHLDMATMSTQIVDQVTNKVTQQLAPEFGKVTVRLEESEKNQAQFVQHIEHHIEDKLADISRINEEQYGETYTGEYVAMKPGIASNISKITGGNSALNRLRLNSFILNDNEEDNSPDNEEDNSLDHDQGTAGESRDISKEEKEGNEQELSNGARENKPTNTSRKNEDWSDVIRKFPAVNEWLSTGLGSVSIDQIHRATGLSKIKIGRAKLSKVREGENRKISAVLRWLRSQEPVVITTATTEVTTDPYIDTYVPDNIPDINTDIPMEISGDISVIPEPNEEEKQPIYLQDNMEIDKDIYPITESHQTVDISELSVVIPEPNEEEKQPVYLQDNQDIYPTIREDQTEAELATAV